MTYGENDMCSISRQWPLATNWIFRTNNFRWSYPYNSNMALPLKIERGLEEQNSNSNKSIDFQTLYIMLNMLWPNYHIKPIKASKIVPVKAIRKAIFVGRTHTTVICKQ